MLYLDEHNIPGADPNRFAPMHVHRSRFEKGLLIWKCIIQIGNSGLVSHKAVRHPSAYNTILISSRKYHSLPIIHTGRIGPVKNSHTRVQFGKMIIYISYIRTKYLHDLEFFQLASTFF